MSTIVTVALVITAIFIYFLVLVITAGPVIMVLSDSPIKNNKLERLRTITFFGWIFWPIAVPILFLTYPLWRNFVE